MTAYCQDCQRVMRFSSGPPAKCSGCQGEWRAALGKSAKVEPTVKSHVYKLSENDRRFLRRCGITQDVPEPTP